MHQAVASRLMHRSVQWPHLVPPGNQALIHRIFANLLKTDQGRQKLELIRAHRVCSILFSATRIYASMTESPYLAKLRHPSSPVTNMVTGSLKNNVSIWRACQLMRLAYFRIAA